MPSPAHLQPSSPEGSLTEGGSARPNRIGDLDIHQDLDVQEKTWAAQRVGWAAMAVFLGAALLGLFGNGLFSRSTLHDSEGLGSIEYDRFGRYESDMVLRIHLTPEATRGDSFEFSIDRGYVASHTVEHITPSPLSMSTGSDGFNYRFAVGTRSVPALVIVELRPQHLGILESHIRLNDRSSVRFRQFIFP